MTRWGLLAMEAHQIIRLRSGWQTSPSLYIFASMWFYRSKVHSTLSRQGSTFGPDCDSAGTNINDQSFPLVGATVGWRGIWYIRPIENGTQYDIAMSDCRDLVWG
jgi:hypothetical protein